ncbi:MAG TPA: 16S rRNA (adenine(1518)-N(6)/adenine(1519)-N(6))-dimethyltransferase RsmA [Candidatus Magasanikbacteria bacterium]|nr:16S rRNA (adenine(1518)-N(6)/adenine(1519)-N(6))-dimethyltransferase RsmA [Candidatus Magasanikbacteria bacterium]
MTPSEIKQLCEKYGFAPSKNYGQNYLISDVPVKKMIEAGKIGAEDTVLEVGPGFGVLTFALAERAKNVVAFEIEKRLETYWAEECLKHPNIEIVWGNALAHWDKYTEGLREFKVVANVPYQITSDIVRTVLTGKNRPSCLLFMVQKEVAERICAVPGRDGSDVSLLTVITQYFGRPKSIANVSAGSFWPAPKVDSAVLMVSDIKKSDFVAEAMFLRVVKAGFSAKRRQLAANLSGQLKIPRPKLVEAMEKCGIEATARAEELSVDEWKKLVVEISEFLS